MAIQSPIASLHVVCRPSTSSTSPQLALAYKVIIHIIGLVLAFLTRKVKVDPLNDSRYSAAIIYCSCVMLVLAVIVVFALSGVNVYAGVWSSFVFAEVCVFLGLTFIPKVHVNNALHVHPGPVVSLDTIHTGCIANSMISFPYACTMPWMYMKILLSMLMLLLSSLASQPRVKEEWRDQLARQTSCRLASTVINFVVGSLIAMDWVHAYKHSTILKRISSSPGPFRAFMQIYNSRQACSNFAYTDKMRVSLLKDEAIHRNTDS